MSNSRESAGDAKLQFYRKFNAVLSQKRKDNTMLLSSDKYAELLQQVKEAKVEKKKTCLTYRRLKRFDILCIRGQDKLITPLTESGTKFRYYVKNEEMYDLLHKTHVSIGHGGKNKMLAELKKKYKNITQEVILMYLKHCTSCQEKINSKKKGAVAKPMIDVGSEMTSRCQVDLVDMQSQADGPFRFIMVYLDLQTKFVLLRALTTGRADEVARNLVDIFCIFGAPSILQSDHGREFANHVITELRSMWSTLRIVHGKPVQADDGGEAGAERTSHDIQNMLITWMQTEKTNQWSEGLKFVQLMKNRAYHSGIGKAPFQAMFYCDIKIGLSTSSLPMNAVGSIRTEEELEDLLNSTNAPEGDDGKEANEEIRNMMPEDEVNVCAVCNTDCSEVHKCKSCGTDVNITCGEKQPGCDVTCNLCVMKNLVSCNRSSVETGLQLQSKRMKF